MASWDCKWILLLALAHVGRVTSSAIPVIHNGTSVEIGAMERTFVVCSAQVDDASSLHEYQVAWRDGDGGWVSRKPENAVFCLPGYHVPLSYLVLAPFYSSSAAEYSCVLLFRGEELATEAIDIRLRTRRPKRKKGTKKTKHSRRSHSKRSQRQS